MLQASARIFGERGFRYATLEDIAHTLGISRPALYHYARSKNELLTACIDIARAELDHALAEARRQSEGLDQLRVFFLHYAEFVCSDFGRCLVLTDRRELEVNEAAALRAGHLAYSSAVQEILARGVRDGSIRCRDPADASRALFGAFNSIPRWHSKESGRTPAEIAGSFMSLLADGLAGSKAE